MAEKPRPAATKPKEKNTSIDLPTELHLRARMQALKDGTTLRDLVIEGLEYVLTKRKAVR
jgi:hypothetical protein